MKPIPADDTQEKPPAHQDQGMRPRRRPANGRPASGSRRKFDFEALEPRTPLAADLGADADAASWDSFNWDDVSWDDAWWDNAWWNDVTTETGSDPVVEDVTYPEDPITSDVPVTNDPVTEEPVIGDPAVVDPVVVDPVVVDPVVVDPVVVDPVVVDPVVVDPVVVDPVVVDPVVEDPVVDDTTDGSTGEIRNDMPAVETVVEDAVADGDSPADPDTKAGVPEDVKAEPVVESFTTQRDASFQTTVAPLPPVNGAAPVTSLPQPGRPSSFFGGFGGWGGSSTADDAGDGFVEDGPRGRRRRPWPRAGG